MPLFRRKTKTGEAPAIKQPQMPEVRGPSSSTSSLGKRGKPVVYAPRPKFTNNYFSSDSGYGSAGQSRTPSENDESETITALPSLPGFKLSEPFATPPTDVGSDEQHLSSASATETASTKGKARATEETAPDAALPLATAVLDGFKVNKRGAVLDEEGDVIGELVDGDILDCVRQKVNTYGEVIDEQGRIVGHVRTVPKGRVSPTTARPALSVSPVAAPVQDGEWVPTPFSYKGDLSANSRLSPIPSPNTFHGMAPLQSNHRPSFASRHATAPSRASVGGAYDASTSYADERRTSASRRPSTGYVYKSGFSQEMISGSLSRIPSRANSVHMRSPSVATMPMSFATTATINRPRTYFTHKGKITVMPGEEYPTSTPNVPSPRKEEPTGEPEKKKKKLFGFGKKK